MEDQYFSSCPSSPERVLALAVAPAGPETVAVTAPIISSYNDHISPLLDAIDRLRLLGVMNEGIKLPTIVVVGDQSHGKSSVLEALAGIHLPRGQGMCTRVPLTMQLRRAIAEESELYLEYGDKKVPVEESNIAAAINLATDEIVGHSKGISDTPLTLVVKKVGVPDLTMVDLPGITRVSVQGQPENICEQIKDIIMKYIEPEESIILNVLSATVDFSTCESIRMSHQVDRRGRRTLAVVTKVDKLPEGLLEKVTSNDVNVGLGYVCVRNRIDDESFEEARREEETLFRSHPLLSKIDKSIVGIPVLAEKLVQIQANIISKCLPKIVKSIDEKLLANVLELKQMPKTLSSAAEAMTTFMQIMGSSKESLRKILLRGEFEEFPGDKGMHGTIRLMEKINKFSDDIHKEKMSERKFLEDEMEILAEAKGIELPNFLSHSAFQSLLQSNVDKILSSSIAIVDDIWSYIEKVVIAILKCKSENYPRLKYRTTRAAGSLISKMKDDSIARVMEIVEMEKLTDYTCNPEYMSDWTKFLGEKEKLTSHFRQYLYPSTLDIEGFGTVEIAHLAGVPEATLQPAFDLKTRTAAYWKIVLRRVVESVALHLKFGLHNLVTKDMEKEVFKDLVGADSETPIQWILEESPGVVGKKEELKRSTGLLKESKEVVAQVMDNIASYGD